MDTFRMPSGEFTKVYSEALCTRLLQHPEECDIRQIGIRISSPNIRVRSGKPDFLDHLVRISRLEKLGNELLPVFIKRLCMTNVRNVGRI